ncbi:MAG: ABC transporter ATP-binding protein [Bacteroidetes bacterium]|nr:ABC transporter ATP-binding protein [Bacteroidota bacterium]
MTNSYISLLKTAWRYARNERKRYVLVYAMFIFSNLADACYPIVLGWFVNKIQDDTSQVLRYAVYYAIIYFVLKFIEWSFHGPARIMERQLAFNLSRNFLQERYHQALHLPVKWHQDHHSGSTINRIRKAYEALKAFFDGGFMYLHAILKFIFSFIAMIYFSPIFGSIGAVMGFIIVMAIFSFDKPLIRTQEEINEREHTISATLFDSLSNIMTVITLRLEKNMETGLMGKVKDLLKAFRKNALINEWKWFTADMLIAVTYGVITVGYIYQHWEPGKIFYVGGLVTLLGFVNQFTSVFHDVAWQYNQIVQYNTDVQTASNIEKEYVKHHRADSEIGLPDNWKKIEIKNLDFSHRENYDDKHRPQSLHNIHISLEHGKRIAFIGESGSGKSTLLALLRGLYEPERDIELYVDGNKSNLSAVNETVTLFPQEPEIFENTIEYNITLGLPFDKKQIDEVCNSAHFSEVILQLPRGLESSIMEKGVNLSGGQKQRLALARGILAAKESEIVLLDEPTSSVDPKTEANIYKKLFAAFGDKAIVSSLHRLHLLWMFDHVYILQEGTIIDEGTFDHLRNNSAVFQDLWRHQEEILKKTITE